MRRSFDRLLSDLGRALNEVLRVDHPFAFWRILVGPWLHNFMAFAIAEMRPDVPPRGDIPLRYVPETFDDFSVHTFSSDYAALVSADLGGRAVAGARKSVESRFVPTGMQPLRRRIGDLLKQLHWAAQFSLLTTPRVMVRDGYFPKDVAFAIWWKSRGRIRFDLRDYESGWKRFDVDWSLRNLLADTLGAADEKMISALQSSIPRHLPRCYLEGFGALRETSKRTIRISAERFFTCNANWHDEVFKYHVADRSARGAELWIGQHGGNYGISARLLVEDFERCIADRFCTWGWHEDEKTIPLPAPKLLGLQAPVRRKDQRPILFVATTTIVNGAVTEPYSSEQFRSYLEWQRHFIELLPSSVRSKMRLRVLRDWGRKFWEPLGEHSELEMENAYESGVSFRERLRACSLFVADHPSTTYAEALASNTPTLMFWDPEVIMLRPAAQPFFDQFRACGILHNDPESAAAELQLAIGNVGAWWSAPDKVAAVSAFKKHYLMTAPDAAHIWTNCLLNDL